MCDSSTYRHGNSYLAPAFFLCSAYPGNAPLKFTLDVRQKGCEAEESGRILEMCVNLDCVAGKSFVDDILSISLRTRANRSNSHLLCPLLLTDGIGWGDHSEFDAWRAVLGHVQKVACPQDYGGILQITRLLLRVAVGLRYRVLTKIVEIAKVMALTY